MPHLLRDFTEKLDFFHIYTRTSHSMNPKKYSNSVWFKSRTSPDKHYTQYGTVTLGTLLSALLDLFKLLCVYNNVREDSKNKFGNLFPFIETDLLKSILGNHAFEHRLRYHGFVKFFKNNPQYQNILYPSENQSWERALLFALETTKSTANTVAVCHVASKFWDLRQWNSEKYRHDIHLLPQPSHVAVNSQYTYQQYLKNNYIFTKIVCVEALRFLSERGKVKSHSNVIKTYDIVVFGDYKITNTQKIIKLIEEALPELFAVKNIGFKPHPGMLGNVLINESHTKLLTNETLELLNSTDIVVCSMRSSVAVEALALGKQVIIVVDDDRLNTSPLIGFQNVIFVSSATELITHLSNMFAKSHIEAKPQDYFFDDDRLLRWQDLLEKLKLNRQNAKADH